MRASALFLAFLLCPRPSAALYTQDDAAVLAAGDRIRILAPALSDSAFIGAVVSQAHDTLVVRVEGKATPIAIPLDSIEQLEVSTGLHGHALAGLGVGLGVGVAVGAAVLTSCEGFFCGGDTATGVALLGLVGAIPGLAIGALVRTEGWEEVPVADTTEH